MKINAKENFKANLKRTLNKQRTRTQCKNNNEHVSHSETEVFLIVSRRRSHFHFKSFDDSFESCYICHKLLISNSAMYDFEQICCSLYPP